MCGDLQICDHNAGAKVPRNCCVSADAGKNGKNTDTLATEATGPPLLVIFGSTVVAENLLNQWQWINFNILFFMLSPS